MPQDDDMDDCLLLTVAEIVDLCEFVDAHNSDGETEIVVCEAPEERECRYVAYFFEYPDEGSQCLGMVEGQEDDA